MDVAVDEESRNRGSGPQWTYFHGIWMVGGEREVFLLSSSATPATSDVVPAVEGEISADDRRKLDSQGVPSDCHDDLSIVRARISLDRDYNLYKEELSTADNELTRGYVLGELECFLDQVEKAGATIHYIGHGKNSTGDWKFKDGYITFADIVHLYNSTAICGRALTIVSDCSYSGAWVVQCAHYLDQQGVRPCAHFAVEKGILLKVYASCRPGDVASSLSFSVRGMINEKNRGDLGYFLNLELTKTQHSFGCNFTAVRCGRTNEEKCLFQSQHYTWQKVLAGNRIHLVRGKDRGQPAWHYVMLVDDEERKKEFLGKIRSGTVDVAVYGEVLKSGWGKDPPNEVVDEIEKLYSRSYS